MLESSWMKEHNHQSWIVTEHVTEHWTPVWSKFWNIASTKEFEQLFPAKIKWIEIAWSFNKFACRINNKNQVVCGINIEKVRRGQNTLNDTLRPNQGYVGQKTKNERLNSQIGPIKMILKTAIPENGHFEQVDQFFSKGKKTRIICNLIYY